MATAGTFFLVFARDYRPSIVKSSSSVHMSKPLGVGIIGAGPVTQAIHLPTLATLGDRLQVVHIMDVNAEVGTLVASHTGARRLPA